MLRVVLKFGEVPTYIITGLLMDDMVSLAIYDRLGIRDCIINPNMYKKSGASDVLASDISPFMVVGLSLVDRVLGTDLLCAMRITILPFPMWSGLEPTGAMTREQILHVYLKALLDYPEAVIKMESY